MLSFLLEYFDAGMAIACGLFLAYGAALLVYDRLPPQPPEPEDPADRASHPVIFTRYVD